MPVLGFQGEDETLCHLRLDEGGVRQVGGQVGLGLGDLEVQSEVGIDDLVHGCHFLRKEVHDLVAGECDAAIAYYLRHREATDEYLRARQAEAEVVRTKIEDRYPGTGLRERLLARRTVPKKP